MDLTLFGIIIEVNSHLQKALDSIVVTLLGMFIDVNGVILKNAFSPIVIMSWGIIVFLQPAITCLMKFV